MPVHTTKRSIFPVLLDHDERRLLRQLSSESGESQCEVVRQLIYREFAVRRLGHVKTDPQPVLKG